MSGAGSSIVCLSQKISGSQVRIKPGIFQWEKGKGKTMINRIKYLMRLRKQNDAVKIMGILIVAGIVSALSILYHTWGIYHYVKNPAEYELSSDQIITGTQIKTLLQTKNAVRVSRQLNTSLTIKYRGKEAVVDAVLLSQEYIEEMFHTKLPMGAKRIILDKTAFDGLQQEWSGDMDGSAEIDIDQAESGAGLEIRYAIGEMPSDQKEDGEGTVQQDQPGRLIVDEAEGLGVEGLICLAGTESELLKGASSVRAKYSGHDLDGLQVERLRKLGYVITNEEMIIKEAYEMERKLLHIRYGLMILGVCLVSTFALRKWGNIIREV